MQVGYLHPWSIRYVDSNQWGTKGSRRFVPAVTDKRVLINKVNNFTENPTAD